MAEEVVRQNAAGLNDLTLDGAQGEALDRIVQDHFGPNVVRKGAIPAWVTLQFTRTSIALGAVTYAAGSIVRTPGGVRFETQAAAAFGAASLGPVSVAGRAVEAGTSGNVGKGTVTQFVTVRPDPTMLVTNPDVGAGGDATESDGAFRAQARAFWTAARRGVKAAIEFGALTVPGVRQAAAEELLSEPLGVPTGYINLYVADANGQSNSVLNAQVASALEEYRAAGIVVTIYGGTPVYESVELSLSYSAGTDTAAAWAAVRSAVVAAVNALGPSETLRVSTIIAAAKTVPGVIVSDSAVVVPAGDVVPAAGQIIRTRSDLVTPA
jgi:uncharacterized phage protein gp47/JayE